MCELGARGGAATVGVADEDDVLDADVLDGVGEHGQRAVVVGVELAVGPRERGGMQGVGGGGGRSASWR